MPPTEDSSQPNVESNPRTPTSIPVTDASAAPVAQTPEPASPPASPIVAPQASTTPEPTVTPTTDPAPVTSTDSVPTTSEAPTIIGSTVGGAQTPVDTTPSVAPTDTSPEPVVVGGDVPPSVVSSSPKKSGGSKKKLWIALIVVIVVLLLGGYAFAFYLPNRPSSVYSSSLTNTGTALDTLINYTQTQDTKSYQSATFNGTFKVNANGTVVNIAANGAFDKNTNGNLTLKATTSGANVTANLRTIQASGSKEPDIYVQVSGIKSYLDALGLTSLDSLDGQWVVVDHTLIDNYLNSLKSSVGTTDSSLTNVTSTPTVAEINDAINKAQVVNKQYIFTTNSSTAVLTNEKFLGHITVNGRSEDEYQVGYNKPHLEAYAKALGSALDASQLNNWSKQENNGKSLSEVMDLSSLDSAINSSKGTYHFDLYADTKTKLVSSIVFADPSNASSTFSISQGYTGGNEYPLSFGFSSKDGKTVSSGTLGLVVNTNTNDYTGTLAIDSGTTTVRASFSLTPSNNPVTVTAPAGAVPLTTVLSELGVSSSSL